MTEILRSKLANEIGYEKEYILRVGLSGGEVYSLFGVDNFQGGSSATRRSCFGHTAGKKGGTLSGVIYVRVLARLLLAAVTQLTAGVG